MYVTFPSDTYFLFKGHVHIYLYHIFLQKRIFYNYKISIQFVGIKCAEYVITLKTVNTEFETTASNFNRIVTDTCFH